MRLLDTRFQTLTEFFEDRPEYAILSHMWGDGEVTFDDIDKPHVRTMAGYNKILKCCQQALKDGFQWVWIDTCCIDKNSSAELTEAINSMYKWYWQAETCYAYLEDVREPLDASVGPFHSDFVRSRWFRRGWTLQELLAPPSVVFFDTNWKPFGTKHDMYMIIKRAAGIDERHIRDRETVYDASIGTVFSWASKRETKRPEDVAYCLLGLFRVHMPLLYGEGTRAFYRLQLELLKQTEDHTIFVWNPQEGEVYEAMGMLAPSPRQFQNIPPVQKAPLQYGVALNHKSADTTYEMTNRGLRIALPRIKKREEGEHQMLAGLTLRLGTSITPSRRPHGLRHISITPPFEFNPLYPDQFAVIELERIGPDRYRRKLRSRVRVVGSSGLSSLYTHSMYIDAESRLKDTTKSHQNPCPMRMTVYQEFAQMELTGISLYRDGKLRPYPGVDKPVDLQRLVIFDDEWATIWWRVWDVPFTITIGHSRHRAGFLVHYLTPIGSLNDPKWWIRSVQGGFHGFHKDMEDSGDYNQYTQHERTWEIPPNIGVVIRSEKTRTVEQGSQWTVAINILDKKYGIVQGDMDDIQRELRLAGVEGPSFDSSKLRLEGPMPNDSVSPVKDTSQQKTGQTHSECWI